MKALYTDKELIALVNAYTIKWSNRFLYSGLHCDIDDIRSEINYAVGNATHHFDAARGVKFTSYAIKGITNAMINLRNDVAKHQCLVAFAEI
jgi:DNA-directed RNA polymerase specialized sigma subunit